MQTVMSVNQLYQAHPIGVVAPELVLTLFALVTLLAGAFLGQAVMRKAGPLLALSGVVFSGSMRIPLLGATAVFGHGGRAIVQGDDFPLV